jgi:rubrerythrin
LEYASPRADDEVVAVLIEWVCEYCGYGSSSWADIVDEIQCPMCGEPVVPVANGAAGN